MTGTNNDEATARLVIYLLLGFYQYLVSSGVCPPDGLKILNAKKKESSVLRFLHGTLNPDNHHSLPCDLKNTITTESRKTMFDTINTLLCKRAPTQAYLLGAPNTFPPTLGTNIAGEPHYEHSQLFPPIQMVPHDYLKTQNEMFGASTRGKGKKGRQQR